MYSFIQKKFVPYLKLLVLILSIMQSAKASDTITMGFAHKPSQNPQYMFYKNIYTLAFKELGYSFKYKIIPSKRSSVMANQGYLDGEPQRIFDYGKLYPNLIRVDEPIFTNRTIAYTNNPNIKFTNLKNLNNDNYRVDYMRGSVWSQKQLKSTILAKNLSTVSTNIQGFRKLIFNRTDIFITLEVWALKVLSHKDFKNSKIKPLTILSSNLSYPYLHKSHSNIIPKLEKILKQMKIDGRYKKILHKSMNIH